ncbi:hypothetical protein WICPIJ_005955 [Wickerhamomyces pijperi]|uniref:Uncharacterized protein n=1 Tax=Wickerhamomyces pijperi TaxID=599730 RepID=A0A9P8Q4R3_WICPI|nr:hypothetical protein WICPIJ_005955 [Wickerhamomyces pijperi]
MTLRSLKLPLEDFNWPDWNNFSKSLKIVTFNNLKVGSCFSKTASSSSDCNLSRNKSYKEIKSLTLTALVSKLPEMRSDCSAMYSLVKVATGAVGFLAVEPDAEVLAFLVGVDFEEPFSTDLLAMVWY